MQRMPKDNSVLLIGYVAQSLSRFVTTGMCLHPSKRVRKSLPWLLPVSVLSASCMGGSFKQGSQTVWSHAGDAWHSLRGSCFEWLPCLRAIYETALVSRWSMKTFVEACKWLVEPWASLLLMVIVLASKSAG